MPDNAKAAPASARYVAIERSAKMPAKCEYPYVRIAVVLTTDAERLNRAREAERICRFSVR